MGKQIVWTDQAAADIRGIEQPIAIRILRTLGRYVLSGEAAMKQLKGITPPLVRLRAQNRRIFFRDQGNSLKIEQPLQFSPEFTTNYQPRAVAGRITGPSAARAASAPAKSARPTRPK